MHTSMGNDLPCYPEISEHMKNHHLSLPKFCSFATRELCFLSLRPGLSLGQSVGASKATEPRNLRMSLQAGKYKLLDGQALYSTSVFDAFSSRSPFSYCSKQLGARLPQIGKLHQLNSKMHMLTARCLVKNLQTQCEGLSPAMFFFSIFGNVTFAMAILMKSTERNYLITNASWLAGLSQMSGTPERSRGSLPILFHRESVDCLLGRVCKCYAILLCASADNRNSIYRSWGNVFTIDLAQIGRSGIEL
jgi:hypothetical protein